MRLIWVQFSVWFSFTFFFYCCYKNNKNLKLRLIWVQFSVWFSFTITHIHILINNLYLAYNSITSIPFNSSSFQNHSISLSFSSILPFLPSFQSNSMISSPIHPISYSFHICTLLDNQIFKHVANWLHCHSIRQQRVKLVLLKVSFLISSLLI